MKKIFTFFAALAFVAMANAQNVDFAVTDILPDTNTTPGQTEYILPMNEALAPVIVIANNGEELAATDTLFLDLSIAGIPMGSLYLMGAQLAGFSDGAEGDLLTPEIMPVDTMNAYSAIFASFEICFTARVSGVSVDVNSANDTKCVTFTRGNVGIEANNAEGISVYPNPANNVINVANAANAQVTVFDMNGRMMYSTDNASANQVIDATNFANGLYIVRIVEGNNVITKKVNVVK